MVDHDRQDYSKTANTVFSLGDCFALQSHLQCQSNIQIQIFNLLTSILVPFLVALSELVCGRRKVKFSRKDEKSIIVH